MEQQVLFPGPQGQLEGILRVPDGAGTVAGIVVCHPHPQYGGSMDNNVVAALVAAAARRGIASLRFNFRGVGRSAGAYSAGEGEQEDVKAALAFLAAQERVDPLRLGLTGYSFGARVCLGVAPALPGLRLLVLISSPLRGAEELLSGFVPPKLFMLGEDDNIAHPVALRQLAARLPQPAQVAIVPGADHFWSGYEFAITETVGAFLGEYLGDKAT